MENIQCLLITSQDSDYDIQKICGYYYKDEEGIHWFEKEEEAFISFHENKWIIVIYREPGKCYRYVTNEKLFGDWTPENSFWSSVNPSIFNVCEYHCKNKPAKQQ